MRIELLNPTPAQPLDEEGDPIGKQVTLDAGFYRVVSIWQDEQDPPGRARAWLERDDKLYLVLNLET